MSGSNYEYDEDVPEDIALGRQVQDRLSGLQGTVIGRFEYLCGSVKLLVQPDGHRDGKPMVPFTVSARQCLVVSSDDL